MPSVAVQDAAADGGVAGATDPDRWAAHRKRASGYVFERDEPAVEADRLLGPGARDDLEVLVRHRSAGVEWQAECVLPQRPAHPDAEDEPPTGEPVDVGRQPASVQRVPVRNNRDGRTELNPFRLPG
jgi:hypothetical protein